MNLDVLSGELETFREAEKFWRDMLVTGEDVEILVPDRTTSSQMRDIQRERVQILPLVIPESIAVNLQKWSSRKDSLLYVIVLSSIMTVLAKLRSNPQVMVGCPATLDSDGSMKGDTPDRLLPVRFHIDGTQTVKQLWKELNVTLQSAYSYQFYPLEQLVKGSSLGAHQLGQVVCEFEPMHGVQVGRPDFRSEINGVVFSFRRRGEMIEGVMKYNGELYTSSMMESLAAASIHMLQQMAACPDLQLQELSIVNEREKKRLLGEFHPNKGEFPEILTVRELFEEQVQQSPNRTALVYGDTALTYDELNERADKFAGQLEETGIKPGHVVGVVCDRSPDMVAVMLAIFKTGAAYMPIDPDYPKGRIHYMLEDSGAACLVTPSELSIEFSFGGCLLQVQEDKLVKVSELTEESEHTHIRPASVQEDTAYVIYTSGSTGQPKGVMVGHPGMANLQLFFRSQLGITENDRIVQFASASFDASIWEMFMAFFTGAELHLLSKETIETYSAFTEYIRRTEITVMTLPPTYAVHLEPAEMPTIRMLITAGSASTPDLARRYSKHANYVNAYGPTESTICATVWQTGGPAGTDLNETTGNLPAKVPIGKPIRNTQIYIVNDEQQLLPVGFTGELCIGGVSLAQGYLGRDRMTAERFVDNPFAPGELMYKSGDYAKWLSDGNIEFIGRIDHQVKIRGFRIETGEIETRLLEHPQLREVFVTAKNNANEEAELYAYFTRAGEEQIADGVLQQWLAERLPSYMIPQYFILLDDMPLTPNGKIDTKALPEPFLYCNSSGLDALSDPEATVTERRLAELWKLTLGIAHVGLEDHYFHRGGHSLKAAQLISEIYKEFQVQLPLRKLMEVPVLREMAAEIDQSQGNGNLPPIHAAPPRSFYPLSLAQKRLFILNQYAPDQLTYNLPVALRIVGPVQKERLQKAIQELVRRHEALRTSFRLHEGQPVQCVHDELSIEMGYRSISENNLKEQLRQLVRPFDLAELPLLRVELLHLTDENHVLCLDMHHIISDGVSMSVLIDDLLALYQEEVRSPLRLQYKDYACWQNQMLGDGHLAEQEQFWLNEFTEPAPLLQIPTDYPRQSEEGIVDDAVTTVLSQEDSLSLRSLAINTESTLYMILLAAYSLLLSKVSGQKDIVVGTPVAGRSRTELMPLIGMFVNILPIRSRPEDQKTIMEYLSEVRMTALTALEYQDYPFDELVRKLKVERETGRNPLFDASFAMQNMELELRAPEGLKIEPVDVIAYRAKFDLTLWAEESGLSDDIKLTLEYRTSLFKKETAETLIECLGRVIKQMVDQPNCTIGQIDLRSSEEIEEQERRLMELEAALEMDFEF